MSFDAPEFTADVDATGVLRLLEAVRSNRLETRVYQASTSELYGLVQETPQSERTPFYPRSPYGVAKLYAFWIVKNYREAYGMHASNGILFNHESPRRGENFVTRKITLSLARIKAGLQPTLTLGNLDAKRDWGFAGDYVEAMWLMLQQAEPDDYVIATGETRTVREFIDAAAPYAGFDIVWEGEGVKEVGRDRKSGKAWSKWTRDTSGRRRSICCSATRGRREQVLGWKPRVSFHQLVELMMKADLATT